MKKVLEVINTFVYIGGAVSAVMGLGFIILELVGQDKLAGEGIIWFICGVAMFAVSKIIAAKCFDRK